MKGFLTFLLGILGLASLVGAGFFFYKGGGLVPLLKEHDSELQALDDSTRQQVLEAWVDHLNKQASMLNDDERRETLGPSIKEVQGSVVTYLERGVRTIEKLPETWAETEEGAADAEKALESTEADLIKAEQNFDSLSEEDKASVKADAAEAKREIDKKFSEEDLAKRPELEERIKRVRTLLNKLQ